MKLFLIILIVFFAVLVFLPVIRIEHWTVRIWDYPRKQSLVLHLAFLAIYLFFFHKEINYWIVGISTVSIIYLIINILPYTNFYPVQLVSTNNTENSLSIIISNVEMKNDNTDSLLNLLKRRKPDLIMLLETDKKWQKGISEIEKDYPFTHHYPLENTYGILFYSKKEIRNFEYEFLVNEEIPSVSCQIKMNDKWVNFYGLHPEPPFPTQSKNTEERDAEILMVAKTISEDDTPTIVAGDLNDVAWSFTTELFQKKSRMLDPRIGRGFFSTFHARKFYARWPLDHIFVSKEFQLNKMERLQYVGSDHFPIYIQIALTHSEKNGKPENINGEETKKVEEKIKKPNEQ